MNWESSESHLLLNPRLPQEAKDKITRLLPMTEEFRGHIWLLTSGSTMGPNEYKCVALSKQAVLASAKAVNTHFQCISSDRWLNSLPKFHVGGLGIEARGYLSKAKVFDFDAKWDARLFVERLENLQITLTSLVPAQLFDIIQLKVSTPKALRAVIVGGGALDENLCVEAKSLGWPVFPSYGLTEAASSVATASPKTTEASLLLLEHIEAATGIENFIEIKGPSLLTAYAMISVENVEIIDPKIDGWFTTEDRGELYRSSLCIWGRGDCFVKIGGESVDLGRLEKLLDRLKSAENCMQPSAMLAVPDTRLGHTLHVVVEGSVIETTKTVLQQYQTQVMPFEKFRQIHILDKIPRSPLGKILKKQILANIVNN